MKKLVLLILLLIPTLSLASQNFSPGENEFGILIKYNPFAGIFERTFDSWSYTQESVLVGVYSTIWLDSTITLDIQGGIIPGSSEDGNYKSLIGYVVNTSINMNRFISLNYGITYYWKDKNLAPIYDMCNGVVQRADFQVYIPLFIKKLAK